MSAFRVKVTVNCQNVNICPDDIFRNHPTFCFQTWYCDASLWVWVSCKKIDLLLWRSLQELIWSKYDSFYCIFWTADTFVTKLGLMAHHHTVDCLVRRFDCCVVVKVNIREKVQNSSECSSGQYLFSCWTLCNQTWYGYATSGAKMSCKKIGMLSSSSGSQWTLIWSNMAVSTISAELLILLPVLGVVHSESFDSRGIVCFI